MTERPEEAMTENDLRDRLFDRIGVPRDCGWTDDQLFDYIDLGLRTNSRSPWRHGDQWSALKRDVAWAMNAHGVDGQLAVADHDIADRLLGRDVLDFVRRLRGEVAP